MSLGVELAQSPKHGPSPQDSSPFRQILVGAQGEAEENSRNWDQGCF